MKQSCQARNQQGFSLVELMVAMGVMLIISGAVFSLMRDSLKVTVATYELTDAQEGLRSAQESINRDLLNTGDGLRSISTILAAPAFVSNYITRTPVAGSPIGILTTDNDLPAGTAVPQSSPAATIRTGTDRQTILAIDPAFVNGTGGSAVTPTAISADGGSITVLVGDLPKFTIGEIYFLTSSAGSTFGAITSIDSANRNLIFGNGDACGLNLTGNGGYIKAISASGTLATSLRRVKMTQYYVTSTGLLMRRVFGVKGTAFRESAVAEHVLNVQFTYSMATTDSTGNVVPSISPTLATSAQQLTVRQVSVKVTVETPHALQNGSRQQLSTTTSTSVRNMQFREALQP